MAEYARENIDADDKKVLDFFKEFAGSVIEQYSLNKVADATGLSPSAVKHMRFLGKGSAPKWARLFAFALDIPLSELPARARAAQGKTVRRNSGDTLESLIQKVQAEYSDDELHVWLQLLLAKRRIEEDLGKSLAKKKVRK